MRISLVILSVLTASLTVHAQTAVKLTNTNITGFTPGTVHYVNAAVSDLKPPQTGPNQNWDYSSITTLSANKINLIPAPSFSATAVADTSTTEVVINGSESIRASIVYDIDDNGLFFAGRIIPAQAYSEAPVSGNPQDSSFWLAQTYITRQNLIVFPATSGSSWKSSTVHPLISENTVTALGLKKAPSKVVVFTYTTDTVVGWGTLKIPTSTGSSIPYNVLLVREHSVAKDSF